MKNQRGSNLAHQTSSDKYAFFTTGEMALGTLFFPSLSTKKERAELASLGRELDILQKQREMNHQDFLEQERQLMEIINSSPVSGRRFPQ